MAIDESELEAFQEAEDYESFDDEGVEAESDEAEFIGPLLSSLPIIGPALAAPFMPRRPPLRPVGAQPPARGVASATLNTPRGAATIRLPEPLVTREEFNRSTGSLRAGINRNTARLNTVARDLTALGKRVQVNQVQTRSDIGKIRKDTRAQVAKLKRDISSQNTMNMLMGMMAQRQVQTALDTHTHPIPHTHTVDTTGVGTTTTPTSDPSTLASSATSTPSQSNPALMLLPLMLSGGDGGFGGDNMLPLVMMMAFMR